MKNVRMGSSLLTNLPLLHCNFQELSKIEHKAIMLFFVPIVFILWGISNPLNAQRCMAPDPIVFENSPTLCQKNNDFDADITISGVKYLSNLGYTTWPYGQSDFVSKDIEINGVLIIDQPAAFVFSRVKMGPGARIIVWDEGDELLSYFTDFFACTKMWMGIEFIRNSVGQIYYSNIEDAQYAIHMGSESDVSLYINRFNRNYVSVKNRSEGTNGASMNFILFARNTFDCTSALLLGYTGQAPAPEEISLAGIELNNASMTISAPHAPNVFKRLSHGALLDQSLFAINGAIFESMEEFSTFNSNLYENSGAGIYAENSVVVIADVTFQDNDQEGILTEGSSLDVRHAKFIENRFGCFCWNNGTAEQIQIEQCIFNNNVTGIAAQRPIGGVVNAVGLKIHDNAFYRNGIGVRETLPGEIYVNSFGLSIDICEITNNDITIENIDSPVGIFIYGSRGENQRMQIITLI